MLYLVDLEAVETRYTGQWKKHLPELIRNAGIEVTVVEGTDEVPPATTPGAFLNFGGTNIYKATQVEAISRMFCAGTVKPGDQFLFTDAWHPGIINLKYMSELLNIPVRIHGMWHAGSYDPADFLGRLIGDKPWVRHFEKALFNAIDFSHFATNFHIEMFCKNLLGKTPLEVTGQFPGTYPKILRSGWPFEYLTDEILRDTGRPGEAFAIDKQDMILFPHRLAPEKQVDIFKDLENSLPQYKFVIAQMKQLTKEEYHTYLGQAKMVFSANLQETLGIGAYEGVAADAMPLVPDRLSYSEMYVKREFVYPSDWTTSFEAYKQHKPKLIERIVKMMDSYDTLMTKTALQLTKEHLDKFYFHADNLLSVLKYHADRPNL